MAPLRHRDFRLLITAFAVSASGSWAYNVALAVFVFEQTHSPAWVGAATVGRFIPALLLGAYGGVLAERFERVRLMVGLDWVCAGLMSLLAVVAALGGPPTLAIVLAGLTSLCSIAYEPAVAAITPETVPETDLAAANTLRNTVDNVAVVAGPAIGAALLFAVPPTVAFAANALSFVWSALVVSRMRVRSRPVDVTEGGQVGPLRQMTVGFRAIAGSATATMLVAYSVIASFVYGVDTVQFVVLSDEQLGTGATGYGYLLAGLGVGGVAAAGLVNRLAALPRLGTVILAGMAVYCLPTLLFLVVSAPPAAFAIEAVRGAGTLVVDVLAAERGPCAGVRRVLHLGPGGDLAGRAPHAPGDRVRRAGRQPLAGRPGDSDPVPARLAAAAPDGRGERRNHRSARAAGADTAAAGYLRRGVPPGARAAGPGRPGGRRARGDHRHPRGRRGGRALRAP
jgi:MFS family permease